MRGTRLSHRSYADLDPRPGGLIYCDPPYANTTSYSGVDSFDHAAFWATTREWSAAGCVVLVSEYSAPLDVPHVWAREATKSLTRDSSRYSGSVEKLFVLMPPAIEAELARAA